MKTEDIERMIRRTKRFNMDIILDNPPMTFSSYIQEILEEKNVKRSHLIRALNLDRNYGYQILNGTRLPTKQQIIRIGLYLQLSVEQVQRMLNQCERDALYVRRPEDAMAVHCLEHKIDYEKACEYIWGEK
ncbi:MAG: hypothetical protein ACI4SF_10070 [Oscillospiraceae bacterium]